MGLILSALWLAVGFGRAQETVNPATPDPERPTFGVTVVRSSGFRGEIYLIPPGRQSLPKFEKLEPVGAIYTPVLNVPPRNFSEGFPGVTDRFEWFAIDYTGRFWIDTPGLYRFALTSDDGSRLYIDGKQVVNNDHTHPPQTAEGHATLKGGIHQMRVSYFQGPRYHVALVLQVAGPEDDGWRIFNTDEFRPPSNPEDWKYGDPNELQPSPNPNVGRRRLGPPKTR